MIELRLHVGDAMTNELFEQFGFDRSAIEERLNLLGLGAPAVLMIAEELQSHVIQPNVDGIVEEFYDALELLPQFQALVQGREQINHLKMTQRRYLLSMGQGFDTPDYFESRLRVGFAHQRAGVSLSLYQSLSATTERTRANGLRLVLVTLDVGLAHCFALLDIHNVLHVRGHVRRRHAGLQERTRAHVLRAKTTRLILPCFIFPR